MQLAKPVLVEATMLGALILGALALARGYATEIVTLDVIQPSQQHPRHDHQLIFPLQDGRLLLVWSEYYRNDAPQGAGVQRDDMPCRISAMVSADRGRTWGDPFVLQENTGKLNVKHPNLLRLPSGEILFFFTQWNSHTERIVFMRRSGDDAKTWSEPIRVSLLPAMDWLNGCCCSASAPAGAGAAFF